ncbi:SH3 domain-containing protein [Ancylobacter pratisalsi]|nr:SH3 domain-containing protein [Ancylobacter pratisalsi]
MNETMADDGLSMRAGRVRLRRGAAWALGALLVLTPLAAGAQQNGAPQAGATAGRTSGLPVPRFVSIKADKVNVRSGPSLDHAVAWVFTRAGLPVEVTAEFETWRRIRDSDGAEGWVYHSMLSGRRTALVSPWSKSDPVPLYESREETSSVKARLEPGVLGKVEHCDGKWCRFFDEGFDGFIEQEKLWGVYPGEKVE